MMTWAYERAGVRRVTTADISSRASPEDGRTSSSSGRGLGHTRESAMDNVGTSMVIDGFEYNTAEKRVTPVMAPRFRGDFSSSSSRRKASGGTLSATKCDPRTSTTFKDDRKGHAAVKFSKLQQENESLRELLQYLGSLGETEKAGAALSLQILLGKDSMDGLGKKDVEESDDEEDSK